MKVLTRSITTLIYPILDRTIRISGDLLYNFESLRPLADAATNLSSGIFVFEHPLRYQFQVLTLEEKRKSVIGKAHIDRSKCLPWSDFKNCIVCQELCPLPEKAVILREERVVTPEGKPVMLKRPFVVGERCVGCGICQYRCPVSGRPAITVQRVRQV